MGSKKRFLFTTQPASHIQAMLPVARELRSRGHDVAFASAKSFGDKVEELGFEFLPAGFDWLESDVSASFPEVADVGLEHINLFFMRKLFTDSLAYPMIDDLIEIGRQWQPDVIVRQQWEFGGCVAAEKLGVPHALMSCGQNFRIWEHMIADRLGKLREHYGLDPDPKLEMLYRYLYLDYLPPVFQFPSIRRQRTLHLCRGDLADGTSSGPGPGAGAGPGPGPGPGAGPGPGPGAGAGPKWLADIDERPLVYVTAGTTFNHLPGYFETILEALEGENLNVVVTTGRSSVAEILRGSAKEARVEAFVPQEYLLRRCALMISHGGLNTLLGAFHHGVPVLTIPVAADMGQNGLRAEQIGCGLCIPYHRSVATYPRCEPLLDAKRFTVENVRAAVRRILTKEAFRDAAKDLQTQLKRMPGPERGADLIEELAEGRKPIVADRSEGESILLPEVAVSSPRASTATASLAVFGATGFIGKRFCELSRYRVGAVPREQRAPGARDILYLISTTDNYSVFDDVHRDVDVNLKVLLEVLETLKGGDHRVTFVSSWFVYGNTELPAREESPCRPKGFYSITKHTAERLLSSFCETFGIPYRILRLCNVYGPGDGGVSKRKNALQFLINELREHRDISLYHRGDFLRDYMHVDDVARALDICLDRAPWGSITNVGSGDRVCFRDLIEQARDLLGSKSNIAAMEPPEFHRLVQVRDFVMDTSRLRSLGFSPSISIQEGIAQLCQR